jgi:Uma2 family endonuclease
MLFADLDLSKTYSFADYFSWRFEERIELIKGKIFKMSPAPSYLHQEVTGEIFTQLKIFLKKKECKVCIAPFDVRIPRKTNNDDEILTVLQPDICVICDRKKIDKKGCLGAPDLVVEVLSPGNNAKELKYKYDIYEEAGVKEYWVVSPQNMNIILYTLVDSKYVPCRALVNGDIVASTVLPGFTLHISELFKDLDVE